MNEESNRPSIISRLGTFLLLIGVLVVLIFIASDMADQTYFRLFFIGIILFGTGLILKKKAAPRQVQNNRFETVRRMRKNHLDAKASKEAEQKNRKRK